MRTCSGNCAYKSECTGQRAYDRHCVECPLAVANPADPCRVEGVPWVAARLGPEASLPWRSAALRSADSRAGRPEVLQLLRLGTDSVVDLAEDLKQVELVQIVREQRESKSALTGITVRRAAI